MVYSGTKDGTNYGFYLEKEGLTVYKEIDDAEHLRLFDEQAKGKVIKWHEDGTPYTADREQPEQTPLESRVAKQVKLIHELQKIDTKTVRPLRAILAGKGTPEDAQMLEDLEAQAQTKRAELIALDTQTPEEA